jgi:polar amino acid transport system substrate-binding protein
MRMNKHLLRAAAVAAATVTMAAHGAHADQLDDIRKAGKIRIATAMGTPLFAFVDSDLKPTGSDVETAKLLAADLGVKLDLIEITNAARVPTVQTGKADIVIADLAVTPERAKVIDFSIPYCSLITIVAAPKNVAIKSYDDLNGKRIGVTRATVNDSMVTQNAKDAEVMRFEDDATLITAAVSGQVDIVSTQPPLITAINQKRPDRPMETKFVQKEFMLGVAIPKNEDKLKAWIDNWVVTNLKNGKLNAIYKKFHGVDLQPAVLQGAKS